MLEQVLADRGLSGPEASTKQALPTPLPGPGLSLPPPAENPLSPTSCLPGGSQLRPGGMHSLKVELFYPS